MNIAICDDDAGTRRQLAEFSLAEGDVENVEEFSTADKLLVSQKHFQLVFLDILMPGIGGMDAARKLRARDKAVCIVFVTSVKEYVFDAFDVGALHYLLKPVDRQKFEKVFQRARAEAQSFGEQQEKILVRTRERTETFRKMEILYAECQLKKLVIHAQDRSVAYYGKISALEKQLGVPFYRCHRSYLVNMSHIAGYNGESIRLTNGEQIYLSKERYNDFAQSYLRYLRNGGACFA